MIGRCVSRLCARQSSLADASQSDTGPGRSHGCSRWPTVGVVTASASPFSGTASRLPSRPCAGPDRHPRRMGAVGRVGHYCAQHAEDRDAPTDDCHGFDLLGFDHCRDAQAAPAQESGPSRCRLRRSSRIVPFEQSLLPGRSTVLKWGGRGSMLACLRRPGSWFLIRGSG